MIKLPPNYYDESSGWRLRHDATSAAMLGR
jgi:hypothetical protein